MRKIKELRSYVRDEFFTRILKSLIKMIDIGVEKMTEIHILKSFINKKKRKKLVDASYRKSGIAWYEL